MSKNDLYAALAAPFDVIQHDVRGGVEIDFITGEQCASRLNEVLGVGGWNFRILHQEIHQEADEVWVLGELEALIDGQRVVKQQFGSDKIQRSRSSGAPLDIGFDFKSAATDCLKKCATMIGVGLFLYDKAAREAARRAASGAQRQQTRSPAQERQAARVAPGKNNSEPTPMRRDQPDPMANLTCQHPTGELDGNDKHILCGKRLEAVPERNWSPPELATESWKVAKHRLCWEHFQSVTQQAV